MIILGIIYYLILCLLIMLVAVLVGDILMIRYLTKISWRESIRCGVLYFFNRFKK